MLVTLLITLAMLLVVVLLLLIFVLGIYNRLLPLRNRCEKALSQIDVHLKHRYELIPDLVETVRKSVTHDDQILGAVTDARNAAYAAEQLAAANPYDSSSVGRFASAEAQLDRALRPLMAVVESRPNLKGHPSIPLLQEELGASENRASFACETYNDVTAHYNKALAQFPAALVASKLGFQRGALFEITRDSPAAAAEERH